MIGGGMRRKRRRKKKSGGTKEGKEKESVRGGEREMGIIRKGKGVNIWNRNKGTEDGVNKMETEKKVKVSEK